MNRVLDFKNVLNIIFKATKKKASILADMYLIKEASIIYKWNSKIVVPGNDDINKIVKFSVNESSKVQKKVIRANIEKLLSNSSLNDDIKDEIMKIELFDAFLYEVLCISTEEDFCEENNIESKNKTSDISFSDNEITDVNIMENLKGDFSGVVKFDLNLKKKEQNKGKKGIELTDIKLKTNIARKLGKTVITIIALAFISSFFVSGIVYYASDKTSNNKVALKEQDNVLASPLPTEVCNSPDIKKLDDKHKIEKNNELLVPSVTPDITDVNLNNDNVTKNEESIPTKIKDISNNDSGDIKTNSENKVSEDVSINKEDKVSGVTTGLSIKISKDKNENREMDVNKNGDGNDINVNGDNDTIISINGSNNAISIGQ